MIFDSRKAFRDPYNDFFMRNVARATSAAPTFFSAARFHNLTGTKFYSLIDGGVGKNDPTYFSESLRASYGFGINFYSPLGPIGLSWGFPLLDESYDKKRMFLFSIGN